MLFRRKKESPAESEHLPPPPVPQTDQEEQGVISEERIRAEECYRTALSYIKGDGVEQDLKAAAPYLFEAAGLKHGKALNLLALEYSLSGDGKNAFLYYDQAARLGVEKSMLALGDLFHTGYRDFVLPDQESAAFWYVKAYLLGNESAWQRLNDLIDDPGSFPGGRALIDTVIASVQDGTAEYPEICFIEKKKKKVKRKKV